MKNWKILAIAGGFYYFGELIDSGKDGYIAMKNVAGFGRFDGGRGLPGVARGDKKMTVTLYRFEENEVCYWPESSCYGILPTVNLYEFSGATVS